MSNYIIEKLNKEAEKDKLAFIDNCELRYFKQINSIVKDSIRNKVKFIFVAGPSSSGKTTTAKYICKVIEQNGYNADYISLDDFFVDREKTPVLPNGKKDYESIKAIDIKEFARCMNNLTENKVAYFPEYDFITGLSQKNATRVELTEKSIIVIEGIHAFNPNITQYLVGEKIFKVFVYPEHNFVNLKNELVLSAVDLRLIRRTIRDVGNRGCAPEKTFDVWPEVLAGENQYIFPYKQLADYNLDTTYSYEVMIYRPLINRLLKNSGCEEAKTILNQVNQFLEIDLKHIPDKSLMWEFLSHLKEV